MRKLIVHLTFARVIKAFIVCGETPPIRASLMECVASCRDAVGAIMQGRGPRHPMVASVHTAMGVAHLLLQNTSIAVDELAVALEIMTDCLGRYFD
jgi:hypothetical protein